jgi:hypothetical protein
MAREIIAFVLAAAWLFLGLGPLPGYGPHGSAYAQDAATKIETIETYLLFAGEKVEEGELPAGACNMLLSTAKRINKNFPDDEAATKAAAAATEACVFELPMTHFSARLDAMEANPGDAAACDSFVVDVAGHFELVALASQGLIAMSKMKTESSDEERRFKAAVTERVTRACPEQAKAQGY